MSYLEQFDALHLPTTIVLRERIATTSGRARRSAACATRYGARRSTGASTCIAPGSRSLRRSSSASSRVIRPSPRASTDDDPRQGLDTLRGLLPAATSVERGHLWHRPGLTSSSLLRMRAHPLRRGEDCADLMLIGAAEGDSGLPQASRRRGARRRLSAYLEETRRETREIARRLVEPPECRQSPPTASGGPGGRAHRLRSRRRAEGSWPRRLHAVSSRGTPSCWRRRAG